VGEGRKAKRDTSSEQKEAQTKVGKGTWREDEKKPQKT
jgi:hypothetical protein